MWSEVWSGGEINVIFKFIYNVRVNHVDCNSVTEGHSVITSHSCLLSIH